MTSTTNTQRIIVKKYAQGGVRMCDTTIMIDPIERDGYTIDRIVHVSKGKTVAYWYMTSTGQCFHATAAQFDAAIAAIK
jgi:hypothetical protein